MKCALGCTLSSSGELRMLFSSAKPVLIEPLFYQDEFLFSSAEFLVLTFAEEFADACWRFSYDDSTM